MYFFKRNTKRGIKFDPSSLLIHFLMEIITYY